MKTLLILTLSGTALALLLLVLRYCVLRRMPSTVYYYAWLLVLLRFALPLPGLIPTAVDARVPEVSFYSESDGESYDGLMGGVYLPNALPAAPPAAVSQNTVSTDTAEAPAIQNTETAKPAFSIDWRSETLWLSVWALGAVLSLGLTVLAYLRFTHRLRHTLHRPDRFTCALYAPIPGRKPALYRSAAVRTPLMFGVFSPKIVLPAREMEEELLRNILRHELTHFRRHDTLYKWLAAAVLSAHWFNPISWFIRKELNRACELSCDEMLLRSMSRSEKQSYGNTLLSMAAASPLPAGVVATTFATEKRNLKERLVQIMNYKKSGARLLASLLAVVLLTSCGVVAGPAAMGTSTVPAPTAADAIHVSTVDEFLAALAPNSTIYLEAGTYDLSTAANYGEDSHSSYYSWEQVYSSGDETCAELVIHQLHGLTICGAGMGKTTIAAVPRYANVLRFVGCTNLVVSDLTAGHTTEPGYCRGGVLRLESCANASVVACGLYGCGTIGVDAVETNGLSVSDCDIYECSYNAVSLMQCRDVLVDDCDVHDHGVREGQASALALFSASNSDHVVIHDNRIHDNAAQYLLKLTYTQNAAFLSNEVRGNRLDSGMFQFQQYGATVDGCAFSDNSFYNKWVESSGVYANDMSGKLLATEDFEAMRFGEIDPSTAVTPAPVSAAAEVRPGGEILVTTVDELLSAIGPDRTIVLDGESFDLSTASNYGAVGGEYYYWQQSYDGPQLVIQNVKGLTVRAANDDPKATTLAAIPRYANVLSFRNCEDIVLLGFTAGHTKEPGACSGGVLQFQGCGSVTVEQMRLYGCGILGVQASQCTALNIRDNEIYECSQGAASFFQTDGIVFDSCDIHDVPSPALRFTECGDVSWNGEAVTGRGDVYDVDENRDLIAYANTPVEQDEYHGAVEDLNNPFAAEDSFVDSADSPLGQFAAEIQRMIANDEWEALADRIAFPIQFFTTGYSFVIHDREGYMRMVQNGYFTADGFNERFGFRQRIAEADPTVFGSCLFGNTCLDHLIAFSGVYDEDTEASLKITAISVVTPLWPGRDPALGNGELPSYVPVTPEPRLTTPEIKLYFYEKELGDFTMHVGDAPLTIKAKAYPLADYAGTKLSWSVDDESVLKLTPDPSDPGTCVLEVLGSKKGGVKLTVSGGGLERSVRVYLVE